MRTIARLPLLAVSLIAVSLPVTAQDKWISLFDGKTLEGWEDAKTEEILAARKKAIEEQEESLVQSAPGSICCAVDPPHA